MLMEWCLQEVIEDRIWKGLEKIKAHEFLHEPFLIWWPLPDLNWGPNDYEPSCSPVFNIVTLPRITSKSTSKITSPDYPHDFTDVDDGNCRT